MDCGTVHRCRWTEVYGGTVAMSAILQQAGTIFLPVLRSAGVLAAWSSLSSHLLQASLRYSARELQLGCEKEKED